MIEQLKHKIDADGFAIIEGFLSEKEIAVLKDEASELIKKMPDEKNRTIFSTSNSETQQNKNKYFLDSADKISYFFEEKAVGENGELLVDPDVSLNKIGHALHALNPNFKKITFDERVKEICFQLGFQEPAVVQSMYIFKNPGIGSEVVAHQDASYLYTEPQKLLGFWIALDDATIENGCLWFARGSHKSGVHRRYIRNPDTKSEELLIYDRPAQFYQKSNFKPVSVSKGTCVLIHGNVVHFSEANKTDKPRNAYTFHVIERRDTKYSEANWIQPSKDKPFLSLYKN